MLREGGLGSEVPAERGMAPGISVRFPKRRVVAFMIEIALLSGAHLAWAQRGGGAHVEKPSICLYDCTNIQGRSSQDDLKTFHRAMALQATDEQRALLRQWLSKQIAEPEENDPPVNCRVTELSAGGCYLTTNSPFPRGTRVILSIKTSGAEARGKGFVLVAHPEVGMGVEFLQKTADQRDQAQRLVTTLDAQGEGPELHVEPEELEMSPDDRMAMAVASKSEGPRSEDPLVDFFRQKFQIPVEAFMEQMREARQSCESRSLSAKR